MKRIIQALAAITVIFLFISCTSTRRVSMETMRPADIAIPSDINSLLLIDRTRFTKEFHNIAEGILTGEMPGQDKAAVQASITSLSQTLQYSPRFTVKVATERMTGNSLTAAFPEPLNWEEIQGLCNKYGTDAVVAVEIFDTDFIVTKGSNKVKKTVGEGDSKKEVTVEEFYAEGLANVVMGIRIYDPLNLNIIDQDLFRHSNTWEEVASSPAEAISKLINRANATTRVGQIAGSDYAYKIAPMPVQITRIYYNKSKKSPEVLYGARRAEVNDWQGAARVWQQGLKNSGPKQSGHLSYNLAVAHEVMGDYKTALIWAKESYVKYGNKKARSYVAALESRMWNEKAAKEQLNK